MIGPQGTVIVCGRCERPRAVDRPRRKLCHVCRAEARREVKARSDRKHADRVLAASQRWREENRERVRERERQRVRPEQRKEWKRKHARKKYWENRPARRCADCDVVLELGYVRSRCTGCWAPPPVPSSPACPTVQGGPCCSLAKQRRPVPRSFTGGPCAHCATLFMGYAQERFCSRLCNKRWWRQERRVARREAERNDRLMVFVADGWICRLCGKPTADEKVPHPLAPTVDHVIPVARGGTDAVENLVCAHFICNSQKRDMTMDEWRERYGGARTSA